MQVISEDGSFGWEHEKDALNVQKHGFSFSEILEIFDDPFLLTRNGRIRIISARQAEPKLREVYYGCINEINKRTAGGNQEPSPIAIGHTKPEHLPICIADLDAVVARAFCGGLVYPDGLGAVRGVAAGLVLVAAISLRSIGCSVGAGGTVVHGGLRYQLLGRCGVGGLGEVDFSENRHPNQLLSDSQRFPLVLPRKQSFISVP